MRLLTEEDLGIDNRLPEFKTFIVAKEDDFFYCGWDYINNNFPQETIDKVKAKILEIGGESGYVEFGNPLDFRYFEVQWD